VFNPKMAATHPPPQHQVMLALAVRALDEEQAAAALRAQAEQARYRAKTPAKWRAIHSKLDRAAAAMGHLN
jgi:hypothetical protein